LNSGRRPGHRPTDVVIVNKETGEQLPCELAYQGIDDRGMHVWEIGTPFDPVTEMITVGTFPPRTTLSFPMFGN